MWSPRATATRPRSRTRSTNAPQTTAAGCTPTRVSRTTHSASSSTAARSTASRTGIGLDKAAHIYWRAQSAYLTPTSDFADFADSLDAACRDKIGDRITAMSTNPDPRRRGRRSHACRLQVGEPGRGRRAATSRADPVQLQPMSGRNPPALCGPGTRTRTIFSEGFENGLARWSRSGAVVFRGARGPAGGPTRRFRRDVRAMRRSPRHPTVASVTAARRTSPRATRSSAR